MEDTKNNPVERGPYGRGRVAPHFTDKPDICHAEPENGETLYRGYVCRKQNVDGNFFWRVVITDGQPLPKQILGLWTSFDLLTKQIDAFGIKETTDVL